MLDLNNEQEAALCFLSENGGEGEFTGNGNEFVAGGISVNYSYDAWQLLLNSKYIMWGAHRIAITALGKSKANALMLVRDKMADVTEGDVN